jgi:hypothetical protein
MYDNFRPDLFDYKPLLRNSSRGNLEHAFKVANTHLGVPLLLDPEGKTNINLPNIQYAVSNRPWTSHGMLLLK